MYLFAASGISKRLYLLSFVVVIALGLVTAFAWSHLSGVKKDMHNVATVVVPQQQRLASIELNLTRSSLQLRHALLVRTAEDLASTLADIGAKKQAIEAERLALEKAVSTNEEKAQFNALSQALDNFWNVAGQNVRLIEQNRKDDAFDMLVGKTIPARNAVLEMVAKEKNVQGEMLNRNLVSANQDLQQILIGLVAACLGVTAGLMLFSWYVANTLRARVSQAQAVAARVSQGDLTGAVADGRSDEFSPLLASLNTMQEALTQVVVRVRQGSLSVATASRQIASSNGDLSTRTESQSSSLEKTAGSMEELSATVQMNADNARQANELAKTASSVATQGGTVVADVVRTMKEINESSRKIHDIIGVIDGIAFQTNILALNAAVEAARAGEQGRGFAVVAGEVRSLASRSADAAREIKNLIGTSVERVEAGSSLAERAGQTMTDVVDAIRRVTDIMGAISTASSEQSLGVSQVNEAVTRMDQANQQNAALVEEMVAAASDLHHQASALVDVVAAFRVSVEESPSNSLAQARPIASTAAEAATQAPDHRLALGASASH